MVQEQIFYAKVFREFTGVLYGGMMLFIGGEDIRLGVQAKSLMKQPLAADCIFLCSSCQGFITTAGKHFSVFDAQKKIAAKYLTVQRYQNEIVSKLDAIINQNVII